MSEQKKEKKDWTKNSSYLCKIKSRSEKGGERGGEHRLKGKMTSFSAQTETTTAWKIKKEGHSLQTGIRAESHCMKYLGEGTNYKWG